jgi:hypothetical protein
MRCVGVTNFGLAPLIVSRVLVRGRDANDFEVHDGCQRPLPRGASCVVTVRFVARGTRSRSASSTLLTNAPTPVAAAKLTGSGSGPAIDRRRGERLRQLADQRYGESRHDYRGRAESGRSRPGP